SFDASSEGQILVSPGIHPNITIPETTTTNALAPSMGAFESVPIPPPALPMSISSSSGGSGRSDAIRGSASVDDLPAGDLRDKAALSGRQSQKLRPWFKQLQPSLAALNSYSRRSGSGAQKGEESGPARPQNRRRWKSISFTMPFKRSTSSHTHSPLPLPPLSEEAGSLGSATPTLSPLQGGAELET
ncbi:hypothetical protein EV182_007044, partial [Spiromyces aspiralis]